jgi:hypothetical protein
VRIGGLERIGDSNTVIRIMPTITFKVTPAQTLEVRRAARSRKLSVSDCLRRVALPVIEPDAFTANDLAPGRVIVARAPDASVITKDMIDAALYD